MGWSLVAVVLLIGVIGIGINFYSNKSGNPAAVGEQLDSIAVLPFVNVSGDPNTEYLSDGISDSIIGSLSRLPGVNVRRLNSVLHYKEKQIDLHDLGRKLNVGVVLTGTVLERRGALVIGIQLMKVRGNQTIWSEQYERRTSDVLAIQDEIVREISERLGWRFSVKEKELAKQSTENIHAYQSYIWGRYYFRKNTKKGFNEEH